MTSNDALIDYAFWTSPDQACTVHYSLEQFHEIDFQVNEGFRRIPHGGVEIGGLLFGQIEPAAVRVQAFGLIDCEHLTGPSFNLSPRDLDQLEKQISTFRSDPELAEREILGWFIAHTRSPLVMNEREIALFDSFFPAPNQITVLVKPERFQATKFGFITRRAGYPLEKNAASTAIILPLSGRAGRHSNEPIASIPAPAEKPAPPPVVPARVEPSPPANAPAPALPPAAAPENHKATRLRLPPPPVEGTVAPDQIPSNSAAETVTSLATIPKAEKLPPIGEIRKRRRETGQRLIGTNRESRAYHFRLVLFLLLAAALGCAAGYWSYSELPAAVVPLTIQRQLSSLIVTWPVDQTRQAAYAAIRVNDGAQQPLSQQEKSAGTALIPQPAANNIKVELIVQHWMRDSRGIIRFVKPAAEPSTQARVQ